MITLEQMDSSSTKHYCQLALEHADANGWRDDFDKLRRHPDTIIGRVLSVEQADAAWTGDRRMLMHDVGMTYQVNRSLSLVFLTDDTQWGFKVLGAAGWVAVSHKYRGTSRQEFASWHEYISHYCPECRLIESTDELLAILNSN